ALQGEAVSQEEVIQYQTYTLVQLGRLYNQHGWTMQLHIGAIRNNNARMFAQLGKDTGYDSILDFHLARSLNGFLGKLDSSGELPQTIVYTLYSAQYEAIASAIGNFQSPGVRGKIQLGSGWWYHDQKDGMLQQMKVLSNVGLISTFVGMLTDSRSFLSFTRHEYFRRVLCNLLGTWIEDGELPRDYAFIGKLVQDICFNNADRYIRIQ
ncbi:glucuronate isomerase, partial [Paenibacillus sepulcri]|nr:glucuronate isomerase [Paenibacillus sepulcri]